MSEANLSITVGVLQVLPLKLSARPVGSTATQNRDDGHDTDEIWRPPSIPTGTLHEWPSNVTAAPANPAAQNKDDAQDNPPGDTGTTVAGEDHDREA